MIRTVKDVVDAIDVGRYHSQRFLKNTGTTGDGQWHDWSFASGQPAYDARIGSSLEFTPFTAQGNDAIYFPSIPDGMERKMLGVDVVTTPSGTSTTSVAFQAYDLLGVYPLIDGDNVDIQDMDNTAAIPRYTDGIQAVLVNHVAPATTAADLIVEYVDTSGETKTTTWRAPLFGINKVNYTTSGNGNGGVLYCALDGGVSRINSIQFTTAPGGLWAIYLVKPLMGFKSHGSDLLTRPSATTETSFMIKDGFKMPTIKDGANLGFFFMPAAGGRAYSMHGQVHFIWG